MQQQRRYSFESLHDISDSASIVGLAKTKPHQIQIIQQKQKEPNQVETEQK